MYAYNLASRSSDRVLSSESCSTTHCLNATLIFQYSHHTLIMGKARSIVAQLTSYSLQLSINAMNHRKIDSRCHRANFFQLTFSGTNRICKSTKKYFCIKQEQIVSRMFLNKSTCE